MMNDFVKVLDVLLENYKEITRCNDSMCFTCGESCIIEKINYEIINSNYKMSGTCKLYKFNLSNQK